MVVIGLVSLPMSLGQFTDKSSLETAIAEWCADPTAAAATYGAIGAWDVSGVTDMSRLVANAPCVSTFNEDINGWNMAKVTEIWVRRSPSNHTRATDGEGAGRRRC